MDRQRFVVRVPLEWDCWLALEAIWPLSEAQWERMLAFLAFCKPALVMPDPPAEEPTHAD